MTDFEEPTVETETEAVADDAQLEAEEDTSLPLDEALTEEPAEEKAEAPGPSEPGWIKKRIGKEVEKAIAATEARMNAQYQAQMKPILDRLLEQDAKDLVEQGEFKSIDRAREYLQLKQGLPVSQPKQARNERGQFSNQDAVIKARADLLSKQADKIKAKGLDVMAEFNGNEDVKAKVLSGEWDFYDVADAMRAPKKKVSSPMRSPNGASGSERSTIASMSDEQFDRLDRKISEGARYTVK